MTGTRGGPPPSICHARRELGPRRSAPRGGSRSHSDASTSPLRPGSRDPGRLRPSRAHLLHGSRPSMQSNQARAPFSRNSHRPIAAVALPPPALILYGVPPDVAAECESIAGELRLVRAEVKHLQAACAALKAHPRAILVAAVAIRSWDRAVVVEHAARAGVPLRWIAPDHDPDDVAADVRAWASETLRRDRTRRMIPR
jgi:hypothetical protein